MEIIIQKCAKCKHRENKFWVFFLHQDSWLPYTLESMDWSKCIICGKAGAGDDLRCPLDSLQNNGPLVYSNLLEVVKKFSEIGAIPVNIQISGDMTPGELVENKAKWPWPPSLSDRFLKQTRT